MTRFYLHDATTTVVGSLPGASTLSGTASSVSVAGAGTNRAMTTTLGASQTSGSFTTLANTAAQPSFIRRWVSDPLGVNVFASGSLLSMGWFWGGLVSNTNSNFRAHIRLWLWRPSSGAIVATLFDAQPSAAPSAFGTTQSGAFVAGAGVGSLSAGTSQDGDVLVAEAWRTTAVQSMGTAYTDTLFYDGTQDAVMTSDAGSYFYITDGAGTEQTVVMSTGVAVRSQGPRAVLQAVNRSASY